MTTSSRKKKTPETTRTSPTRQRPAPAKHKGGQPGNENAQAHGFYSRHFTEDEAALIVQFCTDPTLDDEIAMQRVANSRLVASMNQTADPEMQVRMFEALSTGLGRLARLLRDQRALKGDSANGLLDAIGAALDELQTELGVALS